MNQRKTILNLLSMLRFQWCIVILFALMLALSGCSVQDFILHQSGVMSEEEYQKYIELKQDGLLGQDGQYISSELDETPQPSPPAGSVHVTFSKNAYIDVLYYLDSELKTPIDAASCYLMPGECIYYDPERLLCHHPSTRWYGFDRFRVYSYRDNDGQGSELSWGGNSDDARLVLKIPAEPTESEIFIVPLGKYEKRTLELTDFYTDSTGHAQELPGQWIINNEDATNQRIEVGPVDLLCVDYKYDSTKYAFVSSHPSSFYHEDGLVRFETTYASDDINQYSVELRPLEGLFLFDPSQYTAEHGKIVFEFLGRVISEPCDIPDGSIIHYTATPDPGYRHPFGAGDIMVDVSDQDKINSQLKNAITFFPDEQVEVELPRPKGGTIEYWADGKLLMGQRCKLLSGTVITLNFIPWNRWDCNISDGEVYLVTEASVQTVSIDGVDLNYGVFTENEKHMPTLNVVLTGSVKDAMFYISDSDDISQQGLNYDSGNKTTFVPDWLGQNDRIIFSEKVRTGQGVSIKVANDTVLSGSALKFDILAKDTKGGQRHSIRYITKLPAVEKIEFYTEQELATSSTVYESATITVSTVEVVTYHPKSIEHATIAVELNDITEPYTLKDGDTLETSRDVNVFIIPTAGYYVSGTKETGEAYSETMKYSKWEKDHKKILSKHTVQKTWYVTLDAADSYGTCIYKLDSKVVSGRTPIRDGQKLTLEYTLTDSNYKIVHNGLLGFVGNLTNSQKEQCDIPISEALDGKTVKRSDYISIERKEG